MLGIWLHTKAQVAARCPIATRVALFGLIGFACAPRARDVTISEGPTRAEKTSARAYPKRLHKKHEPKPVARPAKPMPIGEAQRYLLKLVNRDRDAEGLEPVAWDDVAA